MTSPIPQKVYSVEIPYVDTISYVFCPDYNPRNTYTQIQKYIGIYCDELGIRRRSIHKGRKTVLSALGTQLSEATICQLAGNTEAVLHHSYLFNRDDPAEIYSKMQAALPSSDVTTT